MEIYWPAALYLLFIVPLVILGFWLLHRRDHARLSETIHPKSKSRFFPPNSLRVKQLRIALLLLGLVFIILGLARPKAGEVLIDLTQAGSEVVFLVDVSGDMDIKDVPLDAGDVSRMQMASWIMRDFAGKDEHLRLGIVEYASNADVILGLTNDHALIKEDKYKAILEKDRDPTQRSSNLVLGLKAAMGLFSPAKSHSRAVVVISSGGDFSHENLPKEPSVNDMIKEAVNQNIAVITVGVGNPDVASRVGFGIYDPETGKEAMSKLDQPFMQQLAKMGKGSYIHATELDQSIAQLQKAISTLDEEPFFSSRRRELNDRYEWVIFPAFLCFLLVGLAPWVLLSLDRMTRWVLSDKKPNTQ